MPRKTKAIPKELWEIVSIIEEEIKGIPTYSIPVVIANTILKKFIVYKRKSSKK